jgi:mRNA-degrading endonuclease toxin of MazEF toxin-antitoxin module
MLGVEHGLKGVCAVNLDHVQTVMHDDLKRYLATLSVEMMQRVCAALGVATGCT